MATRYLGYTATEGSRLAVTRNRIRTHKTLDKEWYFEGAVETEFGFVTVYSQGHSGKYAPSSRYSFVWKGIRYDLSEQKARSERSLVTEAVRFARRITEEHA